MLIAKPNNDTFDVADVRDFFPNVSNPNDDFFVEQGYYKVNLFIPHDKDTHKLVESKPYLQDGWVYTVKLEPLSADELAAIKQVKMAKLTSMLSIGAQHRLDSFAATRGYDNILSACTYVSSTNPTFAAEGKCCVDARDATWAAIYALLADVESGNMLAPSRFDEIEDDLPVLEWPQQAV